MLRDWPLCIWSLPSLLPGMKELIFIKSVSARTKCAIPAVCHFNKIYDVDQRFMMCCSREYDPITCGQYHHGGGGLSCLSALCPLLSLLHLPLNLCSEVGEGSGRLGFRCSRAAAPRPGDGAQPFRVFIEVSAAAG